MNLEEDHQYQQGVLLTDREHSSVGSLPRGKLVARNPFVVSSANSNAQPSFVIGSHKLEPNRATERERVANAALGIPLPPPADMLPRTDDGEFLNQGTMNPIKSSFAPLAGSSGGDILLSMSSSTSSDWLTSSQ